MLLKKDPVVASSSTDVVPSAIALGPSGETPTESIVAQADASRADQVRAVLGGRKDPFRPAQVEKVPTPEPTPKAVNGAAAGSGAGEIKASDGGGGAPAGGGGTDTGDEILPGDRNVVPNATPAPPKVYYESHSLLVRIGDVEGELTAKNPKRLTGLGGGNTPVLLYLGLLQDEKTAVFLVDAGVEATGDGKCSPSGSDCQTLLLKPGETEFLTRGGKTWELDLLKVITKKTEDESEAVAARNAVAKDATRTQRQAHKLGGYAFDPATGFLSKVKPAAKVAAAKKSSVIARTVELTTTG